MDPVVTDANTGGSFNRYNYANNNPYLFTDPDGRCGVREGLGCYTTVFPEGPSDSGAGSSSRGVRGPSPTGAVVGAGFGAAVAVGCDGITLGICALGNPAIVAGGAALGAVTPAAIKTAQKQLGRLLNKTDSGVPDEYQYALVANSSGMYPSVRGGMVHLDKGDVWKYGTTYDPAGRYSITTLAALNVSMQTQMRGSYISTLIAEKTQLIFYAMMNGTLPPGNSRFK